MAQKEAHLFIDLLEEGAVENGIGDGGGLEGGQVAIWILLLHLAHMLATMARVELGPTITSDHHHHCGKGT